MSEAIGFDLIENGMELQGKGHGDAPLANVSFVTIITFQRMIPVIVDDKMTLIVLGRESRLLGLAAALLRDGRLDIRASRLHTRGKGRGEALGKVRRSGGRDAATRGIAVGNNSIRWKERDGGSPTARRVGNTHTS